MEHPRTRARVVVAMAGIGALAVALLLFGLASGTLLGPTGSPALAAPHFVDERVTAGIDHSYDGDFLYFVGGGVAVMDCDGDRRPDLYLAGGASPAALYHNESAVGGALRFMQLPRPELELTGVTGAYPLDIDGDGLVDLAVLRTGENVLLRGLGDCRFERANEAWGFDGGQAWTTAFSATWEGDATWPTLAFGNYLVLGPDGPADFTCEDGQLIRPLQPSGPYGQSTKLSPSWCSLSMLFSDWSRTGERDLRVSNDHHYYSDYSDGSEQLWRVVPGEPPRLYTAADGWQTLRLEGMGIASQDLTGDGVPEVYLTSQAGNRLLTLTDGTGSPDYHDISFETGTHAHGPSTGGDTRPSTAWHPQFDDVNNDGLMDLFVTRGNVEAQAEYATKDPNELFIGQPDGTFQVGTEAADIVTFARSRGAALADLNLDGLLDLVVVERQQNVGLWRNVGAGDGADPAAMGHWLGIRLHEDGPNGDAIGSWIEVRADGRVTQREVTVGGGHGSGELGPTHFGLGDSEQAEVRVQWPDGESGPWLPVAADGFYTVERGGSAAQAWTLP
jgi:hypothetical protein